ncbi:hypothetical protein Tco_1540470 [Tanacetum coccineum]
MGYFVRAFYNISPTRYYKDDSCWSVDLQSKAIEDIINIGSFLKVLVLNHYVLVRKILYIIRTSLTGFPAQSVRSSNANALDSPYLLVLNTRTSQSRQHDMSESDSYYLSD